MEGFFEKYQQLFLENVTGSKNGECVLWARKVQKTGYGAVKYKSTIISLDWLNNFRKYFHANSSPVDWFLGRPV